MVESGESNGWSYRKWDDGTAECWCLATLNSSVASNSGQFNLTPTSIYKAYPFTFADAPSITANAYNEDNYSLFTVLSGDTQTTTYTPYINAARPASAAITDAIDIRFSIYVIGKWK